MRCQDTVHRIDIAFDEYVANSLKSYTRAQRTKTTINQRVTSDGKIISNWHQFLRTDSNRMEPFQFLTDCLVNPGTPCHVQVIATKRCNVVYN